MNAAATVRDYYDALRDGDPLGPFFAADGADETAVKFGISERLVGSDEIRAGLREQTETTTRWAVESRALRVTERSCHAWFSDDVFLSWTDTERGIGYEFDTRWSGTLERQDAPNGTAASNSESEGDGDWRFVGMHVSVPGDV
ncbi:nuclear transport factor 2 family protein [Halorientalis litorea]|uniref:nuclear transport factor 2 family protein n=1 Tax=Halorientalis litorea TaxID=2931977 RepID=UPI001FF38F61|nr:nuclear transport factor 2 family protein [Halorientalis litorea]